MTQHEREEREAWRVLVAADPAYKRYRQRAPWWQYVLAYFVDVAALAAAVRIIFF